MKATETLTARIIAQLALLALATLTATAANLWWDGGTVNISTNGDGISFYTAGTWDLTTTNWDAGAGVPHTNWNNANLDNAIFGGVPATAARTVTLGTAITVNQMVVTAGSGTFNYTVGAAASPALTLGGTYSDSVPTINASALPASGSFTVAAKISGTLSGGLVISHGGDVTSPGTSGRVYLTAAAANDFVGDITVLSGNLHALSSLGDPNNKIFLKGGALFGSSSSAITYTVARDIIVSSNCAIGLNGIVANVNMELATNRTITGSGNLARYNSGITTNEVRFLGGMSGYSGTVTNTGGVLVIQTAATSGGGWVNTGGTMKLNTTDDTHIANGTGKSNLVVNAGTLDMNGKSETINGLSGSSGTVSNGVVSTTSTLTLGDGNATASFGGTIVNGAGTVAVTKIGGGTQTLGGVNTYSGNTTISGGTLLVNGSLGAGSAVTVASSGALGGTGTINGYVTTAPGSLLTPGGSIGTLTVTSNLVIAGDLLIEINQAVSPTNDFISVGGGLTNSGSGNSLIASNVNLAAPFAAGNKFILFSKAVVNGNLLAIAPALSAPLYWTNKLNVDGSIEVATSSTVATNPINITATVSGGNLNLSWPGDHTGWRLLVQTNSGSVGLTTPTNTWFTVPGSTSVNATNFPVDAANQTVFYRLVYP